MILDSRQNNFILMFPPGFFSKNVEEKYSKYVRSLMLPYNSISDFMSSTIQSIELPGFSMNTVVQNRQYGKEQEYKNSVPVADLFDRKFIVTFQLTDAFLNYFIFLDNALNYLSFDNVEKTNTGKNLGRLRKPVSNDGPGQYFEPFRLGLMTSEGFVIASVIFEKPILADLSGMKLSYSSASPEFPTFSVTFKYFRFDVKPDFD